MRRYCPYCGGRLQRRSVRRIPHQVLAADANYSWSDLREECRSNSTRPLIQHKEHAPPGWTLMEAADIV